MKEGDRVPIDIFTTEDAALMCFDYMVSTNSPYPTQQFWVEVRQVHDFFDLSKYTR